MDVRLGVRLGSLLLGGDLSSDNELPDVVLLGEVEESSDLRGPLLDASSGARECQLYFLASLEVHLPAPSPSSSLP
jgi:hypothetical protein